MKHLLVITAITFYIAPWCLADDSAFPGKFETIGQGAVTSHGTAGCQSTPPYVCTIGSSGTISGNVIGNGTFTSSLTIDYTTYRSNGSGGGCAQASGDFTINASNGIIQARQVGLLCEVGHTGLTAHTFNATYWIDPVASTGAFAGSRGSGNLTASDDGPTGIHLLSHLDGVILVKVPIESNQ